MKQNCLILIQPGKAQDLELLLAYDIVTSEHGGQIKIETKKGGGAGFVIQLRVNKAL
jgi:K+-sensing histidine kinase KdpD